MLNQFEKTAHLMRRAAFGARPDEIDNKVKQGLEATVEELVNYEQIEEDPSVPLQPVTSGGSSDITLITIDDVANWWLTVMVKTRRPLRERMVLFWHDHFATSYEKVSTPNGPKHLYWQNQLERQLATGNFRDLCKGINRDPAMLRWLDNVANTKGAVGYVEYAYAKQNKLTHTKMINKDGKTVSPDMESFQAAAANADWKSQPGYGVILANQPGAKSWPMTAATWILIYKQPSDAATTGEALKFFAWAYKNGGKAAEELDYVPMPANVVADIQSSWKGEIKDATGKPVF